RGWGLAGETWNVRDALVRLGRPGWFALGDRDIATHLLRTRLLAEGASLSEATAELCRRLGGPVRLGPLSDQRGGTPAGGDGPRAPARAVRSGSGPLAPRGSRPGSRSTPPTAHWTWASRSTGSGARPAPRCVRSASPRSRRPGQPPGSSRPWPGPTGSWSAPPTRGRAAA